MTGVFGSLPDPFDIARGLDDAMEKIIKKNDPRAAEEAMRKGSEAMRAAEARKAAEAPKPLPQIRGFTHTNGSYYVRAADVMDALAAQAPKVNAALIEKLRHKL